MQFIEYIKELQFYFSRIFEFFLASKALRFKENCENELKKK